jgi:sirohydrochlorin ferrochelatase
VSGKFDAVVLLSHGSVLCGAEQNLMALAQELRCHLNIPVEPAFLNYTIPHFERAVEKLVFNGAERICVVPYFLVHGKFMNEELPRLIEAVDAKYPARFVVAEHIGFHELLADAVIEAASYSKEPPVWNRTLSAAASFCRDNPRCPLHGTVRCPASQREIEVTF